MSKPTKAEVELRTTEVLRIRLDGAEFWDVREYVREKEREDGSPWKLPDGRKPLSDSQIWRYIAKADALIAASNRTSRKKLLRRHLAQRRNLYAKAVSQGDIRAALACVRDEAELRGLYPAKSVAVTGKGGGPVTLHVTETVIPPEAPPDLDVTEEIVTRAADPARQDDSPAPGSAGVPAE